VKNELPNSVELEKTLLMIMRVHSAGIHVSDMEAAVIDYLQLPREVLLILRIDGRRELGYRLAWVRTKAKAKGLIERVEFGIWQITEDGNRFLTKDAGDN
jgi:restriction endonuclease Mrr